MTKAHVFISYVRENKDLVDHLARELQSLGVNTWLDRDDISPGMNWKSAIKGAIASGAFFVACFSKEFNDRDKSVMHSELRDAIDMLRNMPPDRVWLIPVMLNETKIPNHYVSAHEHLSDLNAVKLFEDFDRGVENIIRAMNLDDRAYRDALHLTDLIKHHDSDRRHAIQRLANYYFRPDIVKFSSPVLIEALCDAEELVCLEAINTLKAFGIGAVPSLEGAMCDSDTSQCARAALALSWIGLISADGVCGLIEALSDDIQKVRIHAMIALAGEELAAVNAALERFDGKARKRARKALKAAGIKGGRSTKLPSTGWLVWENETHIMIDDREPMVFRKHPGKRWDSNWAKNYFSWSFEYDNDGTPICVSRAILSPK